MSPRARRRLRVLGVVASCYVAFFLVVNLADRLLLWPTTAPEDARGATRWVVPDGEPTLEIWRARSRGDAAPRAIVLRFYGNADRAERWIASEARSYAPLAVELWGVSYPGFGGSAGKATLRGVAEAADRSADAAFAEAQGRPVFALGASMGTTAALHLAATRPLAGVIAQNPPALRQLIRREHSWWNLGLLAWPVSLQVPSSLDSVENASRAHVPAAFVSSEKDTLVPPYIQRLVVDAYAGPKELHVIPGADHDASATPEVRAALMRWFASRLAAAEAR